MFKKQSVISLCTILIIAVACTGCRSKKEEPIAQIKAPESSPTKEIVNKQVSQPQIPDTKKTNLYSSTPYDLPLCSIVEISKQPLAVQNAIDDLLEKSQGFYFLKKENDKIVVLLQNPITQTDTYTRHNLQFAEIDMRGNVQYKSAGFSGVEGEIVNSDESKTDEWEFDDSVEPKRPLTHTALDETGHVKYIEKWNYSEEEPIKYEMKNAKKKVISVLQETQNDSSNYRKEHVFYDDDGKTTMSLSVNYDGANITRMMFYDAKNELDSVSIISEYNDGFKTKELIYNDAYKLINTFTSDYADGERKDIKVFDGEGNEIDKI